MIRLFFLLVGISGLVAGVLYLGLAWWSAPHRKLLRQYDRMREMLLDAVDASDRDRAERLLDDCRDHLRGLIEARRRLDALDDMADAAEEIADIEEPADRRKLEERIRDDIEYFLDEMSHVAAEVDYDWDESMRRLESFADELEDQREAFAELEDLSGD